MNTFDMLAIDFSSSKDDTISQRQGSSSSDTGHNPANVTLSAVAATDPNSNTVTLSGRGISTAPFIPGTGFGVSSELGAVWV